MSLTDFHVTRERERRAARGLVEVWGELQRHTPYERWKYAVGLLVCDEAGVVTHDYLIKAMFDPAVTCRAIGLLACVRARKGDGGEWSPT